MWWFVLQVFSVFGMIFVMRAVPDLWPKDDAFLTAMLPVAAAFFATHFLSESIDDWRAWRLRRRETKARLARAKSMDSGYEILAPLPPKKRPDLHRAPAPKLIEHEF
jgi:hypothetical protein